MNKLRNLLYNTAWTAVASASCYALAVLSVLFDVGNLSWEESAVVVLAGYGLTLLAGRD